MVDCGIILLVKQQSRTLRLLLLLFFEFGNPLGQLRNDPLVLGRRLLLLLLLSVPRGLRLVQRLLERPDGRRRHHILKLILQLLLRGRQRLDRLFQRRHGGLRLGGGLRSVHHGRVCLLYLPT